MNAIIDPRTLRAEGDAPAGGLSIRHVAKGFDIDGRRLSVLDHINLTIAPGQFVAIVGASGCGKSTLLRLIAGLERQDTGEILLDGKPVDGPGLERGLIFQDHRLFPWLTVERNILLALSNGDLSDADKRARVAGLLTLVGLDGFDQAFPHQLSGGMAQRAAIARALATSPQVLLLDEPLGALDALTRLRLQSELQRIWLARRSTMVMVTHDVDEALFLGDVIVVMQPGRIARILHVPSPHPRDRAEAGLAPLKAEILSLLHAG
ncbi:ABC transporter ATP-binding protein [Niveispirillum sp. KHB5.9]|uniref:ABC transporter ATP-binding protein n=1 Tax=Niveispirillum sp. KHB5.9 TaxID=3400269 RepID=UPI003A851B7D